MVSSHLSPNNSVQVLKASETTKRICSKLWICLLIVGKVYDMSIYEHYSVFILERFSSSGTILRFSRLYLRFLLSITSKRIFFSHRFIMDNPSNLDSPSSITLIVWVFLQILYSQFYLIILWELHRISYKILQHTQAICILVGVNESNAMDFSFSLRSGVTCILSRLYKGVNFFNSVKPIYPITRICWLKQSREPNDKHGLYFDRNLLSEVRISYFWAVK